MTGNFACRCTPATTIIWVALVLCHLPSDATAQASTPYKFDLTVTDTRGQPIDLPEIQIQFQDSLSQTTMYLKDVKPLKPLRVGGVYESILPLDPEDRRTLWRARIRAAGFHEYSMPPLRFPGSSFSGRVTLIRNVSQWEPTFVPYEQLDATFGKLKTRLEYSPSVKLLSSNGAIVSELGQLVGPDYDQTKTRPSGFTAAKACLLNIYHVLGQTRDPGRADRFWIDDVMLIRGINKERVVAKVQPVMFDAVRRLAAADTDPFVCQGYLGASSELHRRNFSFIKRLVPQDDIVSVKYRTCTGTLQLTLARYSDGGVFADFDLDESAAVLQHAGNLLAHQWTGGTDPLQIYEILGGLAPRANFGYSLKPKSRPATR